MYERVGKVYIIKRAHMCVFVIKYVATAHIIAVAAAAATAAEVVPLLASPSVTAPLRYNLQSSMQLKTQIIPTIMFTYLYMCVHESVHVLVRMQVCTRMCVYVIETFVTSPLHCWVLQYFFKAFSFFRLIFVVIHS